MSLLEIKNLSLQLVKDPTHSFVLEKINLSLEPFQTFSLVGESGSGKTTLCLSLLGLFNPRVLFISEGEILYQQEDLLKKRDAFKKIRGKNISLIFQNAIHFFHPFYSMGQTFIACLKNRFPLLSEERAHQITDEWLDQLHLIPEKKYFHSYPHELSPGILQRIMVGVCLSCEPPLLIADEPTASLDAGNKKNIVSLLKNQQKKTGMSLLLISHDLNVVESLSDHIGILHQGKLIESGLKEKILTHPQEKYTKKIMTLISHFSHHHKKPFFLQERNG